MKNRIDGRPVGGSTVSRSQPEFVRRWTVANTLAMFVGYLLYTPLGHGITGGHDRELSASQLLAHCVALAVVGYLVASAQRRALASFVEVPAWRVIATVTGFIVMFWVGYYQTAISGPDTDILLGYLALGCTTWIGLVPVRGHYLAITVAVFSFPVASFVGELLLFAGVIATGVEPNFSQSHVQHLAFWLTVGTTTGILGGIPEAERAFAGC